MNKCVVKISISSITSYNHVEDVIYYRAELSPDFIERWQWFFEYIAARVKVNNPRRRVSYYRGPLDVLVGEEWHEHRRLAMIRSRQAKKKSLLAAPLDDDLFHFASNDRSAKIAKIDNQLAALERDKFPIAEFPTYINKIKDYIYEKDK